VADGAQKNPSGRINLNIWDAARGKLLRKLKLPD
jgi:hypothetical protein